MTVDSGSDAVAVLFWQSHSPGFAQFWPDSVCSNPDFSPLRYARPVVCDQSGGTAELGRYSRNFLHSFCS